MADRLSVPDPDLHALATGRIVVAFVPRHSVDLNDELELDPAGPRLPGELSKANAELATAEAPSDEYVGLVVGLQPAASLGGPAGAHHHLLAKVPDGDLAILRVFSESGPALDDAEFEARRLAIEAMFR